MMHAGIGDTHAAQRQQPGCEFERSDIRNDKVDAFLELHPRPYSQTRAGMEPAVSNSIFTRTANR